ncbi:MAG: hypothetical protein H7Z43_15790 [Clostridia bacterium]|nr:hypothetical protein [Deltaproteobacteria bacterium]
MTSYARRTEDAVEVLARACGLDAGVEVARFVGVRELFGETALAPGAGQTVATAMLERMPAAYELVLTLANGAPRGFGYLTQGMGRASFPESLSSLLEHTLQFHLESRGALADAQLTADLFRTAYPDVTRLSDFSPLSQGMLTGIVPRANGVDVKLYFNTRLDTSVPHRDKVLAMIKLCGAADVERGAALYDALYNAAADTTFSGVGVDIADAAGRVKLYVHTPRASTRMFVSDLIAASLADASLDAVDTLLAASDSDAAATDCEIAFAVRADSAATLKLTVFYSGKETSIADGERALDLLQYWGYPTDSVQALFDALYAPEAQTQLHPLHGLGIELSGAAQPKVNVYAKPNM